MIHQETPMMRIPSILVHTALRQPAIQFQLSVETPPTSYPSHGHHTIHVRRRLRLHLHCREPHVLFLYTTLPQNVDSNLRRRITRVTPARAFAIQLFASANSTG